MQDVKALKNDLRNKCRKKRQEMDRTDKDEKIFCRVLSYISDAGVKTVFTYVSSPELEVDTRKLIGALISEGITVCVPKCRVSTCTMEFYKIKGTDDLRQGYYGIMEPDTEKTEMVSGDKCELCIVPGLAFDKNGFRIGYGKGYYDRFLSGFRGIKTGLCYDDCVFDEIPQDKYDISVDSVVTESQIIKTP